MLSSALASAFEAFEAAAAPPLEVDSNLVCSVRVLAVYETSNKSKMEVLRVILRQMKRYSLLMQLNL